ncbi:hypothetical protein GCM10011391_35010 [Pullulanibacillus camelliae]|uniref:Uncharacterized protein n=2 Tax=Pullulanibacillus camelliae TaxID=1707096 RepID=A0A8J2YMG6_9BACL|nr:hypothetical protein GCM10011391_35010 [Pullulanibacillus camelliae]
MVVFLKALLTKNSFVFFVSLILLGIDSGLPGNISYFVGRANISLNTWLSPGDQFFNLFYFVFLITVFSVICLKLYDKKEFQR